jgi:peptidyl-prolyl cis-trans isomerase SurA
MNFRAWAIALATLAWWGGAVAQTQTQPTQQADFIVAVVNSEPITNGEVRAQMQRISAQLAQQGQKPPPQDELKRNVLERLIAERVQLQLARGSGIRIDDAAVDQAELAVASQNAVDVAELRRRAAKDGLDTAVFRNQLRDQLLLSRLHEREVTSRIRVTDQDIDRFILERQANNTDPFTQDINLAQLLVAVPEKASGEQAAVLYLQAQKLLDRIRAGEDFNLLVQQLSAADRKNDGQLGLRRADRYPPSFVLATQKLNVGEVSEVVRSGAGFHLLRVVERRAPVQLVQTVVQSRARHILLRTGPQLTEAAAIARLTDYKRRILGGSADFQALAREFSQDGSAAQGGDLGWVQPGSFVPEFEQAMNRLNEGEISNPVVSRFGVHLIQLAERRRVDLSQRELREAVRAQLQESKYEEAYSVWARDLRERAFVEMREPPQ